MDIFTKSIILKFRNKKLLLYLCAVIPVLLIFIFFVTINKTPWTAADYRLTDVFYKLNLLIGPPPPVSNRILYLTINDKTYREIFRKNQFRRDIFADIINKVLSLEPEYVLIDLIFAYPSDPYSDSLLISAVRGSDKIFVPLPLTNEPAAAGSRSLLKESGIKGIKQQGSIEDTESAVSFIPDILTESCRPKYGHINVYPDDDGVFRHSTLLLPIDSFFIPSVSLRLFLDYCGVEPDSISVDWGKTITLPAGETTWINEDVVIPVDRKGRMFIPFIEKWGKDFQHISVNRFLELYNDPAMKSSLADFLEGRIVIIGDISTGISDLGGTTLDESAPLLTLSAHELNAFINSVFYKELNSSETILAALLIVILLFNISVIRNYRFYVYAGAVMLIMLLVSAYLLLYLRILIPAASLGFYLISAWLVLFISIGLSKYRENKLIKEEMIKKKYELEQARRLQLSLLPEKFPSSEYFEMAAFLESADEVGGDYYDTRYADGEMLIVMGDVIGHGLKAGMMSLIIKTIFTSLPERIDLKEILSLIDSSIRKFRIEMFFIGLLLLRLNKRKMTILSAGMPPLIYYDSSAGEVKEKIIKSPPAGMLKFRYETEEIEFSPGDIILAYSDGLSELFNPQNEMLGMERIKAHLQENKGKSPAELKESFKELITSWTNNTSPHDDITFIIIKIK